MFSTSTIVLILLGVAAVGGLYLWLRPRASAEEFYYFNCPGCGRKFRYRGAQSGHKGQCPHCNTSFTFPAARSPQR